MKGVCLKFYTYEFQKHHGKVVYEWLLELAKKNGIHGGSVFRTIAGYGRHGVMHEEHFFELASNVTVQIEFVISNEQSQQLIEEIKKEGLKLFYHTSEVDYNSI